MAFEIAYTSRNNQAWNIGTEWSERLHKMVEKWVPPNSLDFWHSILKRDEKGQANTRNTQNMMMSAFADRTNRPKKTKRATRQKANALCACGSGKKFKKCGKKGLCNK